MTGKDIAIGSLNNGSQRHRLEHGEEVIVHRHAVLRLAFLFEAKVAGNAAALVVPP